MSMLLSDYCSEINTRGIKKKEKISSTNYISLITAVRIPFAEDLRASRRQN